MYAVCGCCVGVVFVFLLLLWCGVVLVCGVSFGVLDVIIVCNALL